MIKKAQHDTMRKKTVLIFFFKISNVVLPSNFGSDLDQSSYSSEGWYLMSVCHFQSQLSGQHGANDSSDTMSDKESSREKLKPTKKDLCTITMNGLCEITQL